MGFYKKYKTWKFECHLKKWGSKNVGYFQAFDKKWFEKNQIVLVWLCNHFILKYWFRWILRINKDVQWDEFIVSLEPNNYKVFVNIDGDKIKLKADFRAHNKFSKRIYCAFKYMWWVAHCWDWLVADRFVPEWSFGLLTLTVRPNYDGEPGATSCDGYVARLGVDETFADIIANAGTHAATTGQTLYTYLKCSTTIDQFTSCFRNNILFDTSSLGATATLLAAKIQLRTTSTETTIGEMGITIVESTSASNTVLVAADYSRIGSTAFCSKVYADISSLEFHDYVLNSNGVNNVNKIGISKYCLISTWDFNATFDGSWISEGISRIDVYSSDVTGEINDPRLVITYTYYVNKFLGQEGFAKAIGVANVDIKKILGVE